MQAEINEPQRGCTTSRGSGRDEGFVILLVLVHLLFAAERLEVLSHVVVDGSSCGQSACLITCTERHVRETILQGLALGCEALPSSWFPGALSIPLCRCALAVLVKAKAKLALMCPLIRASRRVAARRVKSKANLSSIIVCDEHSFAVLLRMRLARTLSHGAGERGGAPSASSATKA